MKLCYQAATPELSAAKKVTAYQGPLEESFRALSLFRYDGVELMTVDPAALDWGYVRALAEKYGLCIPMVCTGEVFGSLGLSFTSPDPEVRRAAVARVKEIADLAGFLGANTNIGRVRGRYYDDIPCAQTEAWALEAFREVCGYAGERGVQVALESTTILETNFINTLAEAEHILDITGCPNFKLLLDVFHLNVEEADMFASIQKYCADAIHVHLTDKNRRYPGQCGMDFGRLIRTFHAAGYDGAFCTEILQIPSMEEAAERSYDYLAPIFSEVYGRTAKAPPIV